ncbi:hypothetical protein L2E82_28777 [Cichorium intybus]|uniref:Uncharacterized protein n=1 Tax=Cichorium intybus TaxID=13427 RepID=A0ACB9CWX1_CICIN|nr:hypothetical protein L2E82_28777 [Cichorium intybus]
MKACFSGVTHCWSTEDLLQDIIFGRCSNNQNLKGFYSALLEKIRKAATVMILKVHRSRFAEFPFVGTMSWYQKQGLCRLLIAKLADTLGELGVEKTVLPAVPSNRVCVGWRGARLLLAAL